MYDSSSFVRLTNKDQAEGRGPANTLALKSMLVREGTPDQSPGRVPSKAYAPRFTETGRPPEQVTPVHTGEQGSELAVQPDRPAAVQLVLVTPATNV